MSTLLDNDSPTFRLREMLSLPINRALNGEKLTMKKWRIFGADLFHGLRRAFLRFIRDVNGEKNISLFDDLFHG